jgi:hypothetical protein
MQPLLLLAVATAQERHCQTTPDASQCLLHTVALQVC